jgi:tRNA (guanosine-2'-O-)-methyltransferase
MTPQRNRKLRAALDRRQPDLTILAENVRNPHNVAAMLRTSDAVGTLELHAVSAHGAFEQPRLITGGTRGWVRTVLHPAIDVAVGRLHSLGFQVLAAHFSDTAADYRTPDYTRPTAFLMGSELQGVSPAAARMADGHVVIPMRGFAESLNVSVAAALLLYEAARQREVAGAYARPRLDPQRYAEVLFEWGYPRLAARYRDQGLPYPPLDADGLIVTAAAGPGPVPGRLGPQPARPAPRWR